MIDINAWMKNFLKSLNETFANRVWFVGLQGSYGRGEATETSDIDGLLKRVYRIPIYRTDENKRVIVKKISIFG